MFDVDWSVCYFEIIEERGILRFRAIVIMVPIGWFYKSLTPDRYAKQLLVVPHFHFTSTAVHFTKEHILVISFSV
jgi:hypothetical protein